MLAGAWLHWVWIVTPLSTAYGWVVASAALATLLLAAPAAWRLEGR